MSKKVDFDFDSIQGEEGYGNHWDTFPYLVDDSLEDLDGYGTYYYEKTSIECILGISLRQEDLDSYIELHCNNDYSEIDKLVVEQKLSKYYGLRKQKVMIGVDIKRLTQDYTILEYKAQIAEKIGKVFLAAEFDIQDIDFHYDEVD